MSSDKLLLASLQVVLLGESGVGKTALVSQFMTSEYMNTYDISLGKSNYFNLRDLLFLSR